MKGEALEYILASLRDGIKTNQKNENSVITHPHAVGGSAEVFLVHKTLVEFYREKELQ